MTANVTLLDLDCPSSWPTELLGYLNEHHDLFLRWETKQGPVVSGQDHDEAICGLRHALQPYEILGWHCTRLTDVEADEIRRNGMQLPNAEMLGRRIDPLVKTDEMTPDTAGRLKSENQSDETGRAGKIWFCFYPPRNVWRPIQDGSYSAAGAYAFGFPRRAGESRWCHTVGLWTAFPPGP